jgi:endonuclease-3 related protein
MPFSTHSDLVPSDTHDLLEIYHRLYTAFGPQHWWPGESRFEMIVGAILTQNTAWKNVEKAISSLKENSVLNPTAMKAIPQPELALLIRSSGFFNLKAARLKAWVSFLFDEYKGSLDRMFAEEGGRLREKLLAVKGLGPETVDSILLYAGHYPFFVVDAYTRRVFSRHSRVDPNDTYQGVQAFFMDRLPADPPLYNEYHALIVHLSKLFCKKEPTCEGCPLYYLFEQDQGPVVAKRQTGAD